MQDPVKNKIPAASYVLDNVADAILWVNENGKIIYANKAALHLFKKNTESFFDQAIYVLLPEFNNEAWQQFYGQLTASITSLQWINQISNEDKTSALVLGSFVEAEEPFASIHIFYGGSISGTQLNKDLNKTEKSGSVKLEAKIDELKDL